MRLPAVFTLPPPAGQSASADSLGQRVQPKQGELCAVCNRPMSAADDVYIVNGQRVPVHRKVCLAKLASDPGKYTARLRPAGTFLGVEPDAETALTARWLFVGFYILLGLVFSALSVNAALNAGMRPAPWFFAGLFFNVLAWAVLLARRQGNVSAAPKGLAKIPDTAAPLPCPACGHSNHPAARACLGCGAELRPATVSEASRAGFGSAS
ncbi:MAG: hypothetical protein DMG21_00510 [Acidobacteria bacterium]|nr:MAG: hypothetical protein DMG21_00510 [Acidobacteriota bacterium]